MGELVTLRPRRRGFVLVGRVRDVRATIYANWLALERMLGRPRRPAA